MEFWILQSFNGLTFAALLFLLGGGLTLIFGVMRVVNIAQGTFYLVGGYIGYTVMSKTGNFYLGLVAACAVICLLGILMESNLLRDMTGDNLRMMLITMGVALFFQDLCLVIWGGNPKSITVPNYLAGTIRLGKMNFSTLRLFMLGAAAVLYLALWLFDKKTRVGAMVRAAVDNPEIADGLGINVVLVRMGVFGLGSLLAGFGGVFGCAFMAIYPGLDFELLPYAFVVVILGGLGSLPGALFGAIIVGLADNFSKALIPELSYFSVFAPMAIVLAWRPMGLMGK
jgi:branched-chain amino acid transport system permease protein